MNIIQIRLIKEVYPMPYLTMSDRIKIFYETCGEGETLIFCHGLNSSHIANKEFYDEFRNDYNTVVYD